MKSLSFNAVIGSIRAKVDRSISATFSTPELTPQEKSLFFELQNFNVKMTITPLDEENVEQVKIDKDVNQKSQGQRIRAILFSLFKKDPEGFEDFEIYYKAKTEKYISFLKEKLD